MKKVTVFHQRGASLIMVMIVLTIVSMLGIAAIQISMMSERSARNDRDYQIAWQAAEEALVDAEFDISGPGTGTRRSVFAPEPNIGAVIGGCGASGNSQGLCATPSLPTETPSWVAVNFATTGSTAATTEFGAFTGRTFAAGNGGFQSAKPPRYVIEAIEDNGGRGAQQRNRSAPQPAYVYRITAMGFGPRGDTQAVLQTIYRD